MALWPEKSAQFLWIGPPLEDMSVDYVCEWLDEKGYSDCLVKIF